MLATGTPSRALRELPQHHLRCFARVGSVRSWAEIAPVVIRVKAEFLVICAWAGGPCSPPSAGTCEHTPSPFLIVFPAPLHNSAFVWICKLVPSSVNSWRYTQRGTDFIWVLGPWEWREPK